MVEWKAVKGWEGYEISSAGILRSWKVCRRSPNDPLPRVVVPHALPSGYLTVKLKDRDRKLGTYIHHLVAEHFIGPRPPGMEVAHWDGDKSNNAAPNLRYATPKENGADSVRQGATNRGERHGCATIDNETAKGLRSFTGSHAEAAKAFGVSYHRAYCIRTGRSWAWLGAE
jgi:hypothetical protein